MNWTCCTMILRSGKAPFITRLLEWTRTAKSAQLWALGDIAS
jgi:hypothetical protein